MRKRILDLGLFLFTLLMMSNLHATNYYFSSINGNDGNSGTSISEPRASLNVIRSTIRDLMPGDTVYFERGSQWDGSSLTFSSVSGTADSLIVLMSYGEGENPVFSGQVSLSSPTKEGNIYTFVDSSIPFSLLKSKSYGRRFLAYVTIGGKPYLPARHPNEGYFMSTSTNRISVTDNNKSWAEDEWKDAWVAVKSVKWQWSDVKVTSNTGVKLNTTDHDPYSPTGPKPYFFINAYNAMDAEGEWFYDSGTLSVYWSTGDLPEVRVSAVDQIVNLSNSNYIKFQNLDFIGANYYCAKVYKSDYNVFDHCRFIGAGEFGIRVYSDGAGSGDSESNEVTYSEIADCGLGAIFSRYARGGRYTNNYIHRIAINPGYQNKSENNSTDGYAIAIFNNQATNIQPVVKQNFIDSVQAGMTTHYNATTLEMRENVIRNYGLGDLSDLGGFYATTETYSIVNEKKINRNFFLDVHLPHPESQINYNGDSYIHAIYPDQDIYRVRMDSNTVENADVAIKTNGGKGRTFFYNNILNPGIHKDEAITNSYLFPLMNGTKAESDSFMYNSFVLGSGDVGYNFYRGNGSYGCKLPWKGCIDYNKWFDPTGNAVGIARVYDGYTPQYTYSFEQWQALTEVCDDVENNPGVHSTYNNTNYSEVRMFKNWSSQKHKFTLEAEYVDVDGNEVTDSVIVEPFYSTILFKVSGVETESDIYIDSTLVPEPVSVAPAELVVSTPRMVNQALNISYYPVPVNDVLTLSNLPDNCMIEVFNLLGNKTCEYMNGINKNISLDLVSLKSGCYIIRVSKVNAHGQSVNLKIIKN